ncbi:MAG: hypothetical protein Q4C22_07075 [Bacillota bacterium]|nr:hypothetical protein [Bacillota bacterium]
MYKAERAEDRLKARAEKKARFLKAGFGHCCNSQHTGFVTEEEYVEMYRDPMLKYGITCNCAFQVKEVEDYLRQQFRTMKTASDNGDLTA